MTISTFRGMFTCYANAGGADRIPDLKPGFLRDGAKLYALAKANGGGALLSQGYTMSIGTAAAPSTRHATWNINFEKDNKDGGL